MNITGCPTTIKEIKDEILWNIKLRLGKWRLTGKDLYYLTAAIKLLEEKK